MTTSQTQTGTALGLLGMLIMLFAFPIILALWVVPNKPEQMTYAERATYAIGRAEEVLIPVPAEKCNEWCVVARAHLAEANWYRGAANSPEMPEFQKYLLLDIARDEAVQSLCIFNRNFCPPQYEFTKLAGTLFILQQQIASSNCVGERRERILEQHGGIQKSLDEAKALVVAPGGEARYAEILDIIDRGLSASIEAFQLLQQCHSDRC